jgi:hypothetical protein
MEDDKVRLMDGKPILSDADREAIVGVVLWTEMGSSEIAHNTF